MTTLHNIDQEDATTKRLVRIAQRHCKLALEHSKANTLSERREAIRSEIEHLKSEREATLSLVQVSRLNW